MRNAPGVYGRISIKATMIRLLWSMILVSCYAAAQAATPAPAHHTTATKSGSPDSPRPIPRKAEEKMGLVRGVLKQLDPIHDQMVVRPFGGRDVQIAFDPRTQL